MGKYRRILGSPVVENRSIESVVQADSAKVHDLLRLRVDWLESREKVLLDMYLNQNATPAQLAELCGVTVEAARRRLQRLSARLLGPDYCRIRRSRNHFSREQLEAAYDHFILGLGYRRVAQRRGMTPAVTRRILEELHRWLKRQ